MLADPETRAALLSLTTPKGDSSVDLSDQLRDIERKRARGYFACIALRRFG